MYPNDHTAYGMPHTPVVEAMEDVLEAETFKGAAINVAVMVAVAATFLALLKRSGFRAMIAVGRG